MWIKALTAHAALRLKPVASVLKGGEASAREIIQPSSMVGLLLRLLEEASRHRAATVTAPGPDVSHRTVAPIASSVPGVLPAHLFEGRLLGADPSDAGKPRAQGTGPRGPRMFFASGRPGGPGHSPTSPTFEGAACIDLRRSNSTVKRAASSRGPWRRSRVET